MNHAASIIHREPRRNSSQNRRRRRDTHLWRSLLTYWLTMRLQSVNRLHQLTAATNSDRYVKVPLSAREIRGSSSLNNPSRRDHHLGSKPQLLLESGYCGEWRRDIAAPTVRCTVNAMDIHFHADPISLKHRSLPGATMTMADFKRILATICCHAFSRNSMQNSGRSVSAVRLGERLRGAPWGSTEFRHLPDTLLLFH